VRQRPEASGTLAAARRTNLAFQDWPSVCPNATCATALIDRFIHRAGSHPGGCADAENGRAERAVQRDAAHCGGIDAKRARRIYLLDPAARELVMATVPPGYDGDLAQRHRRTSLDGPLMGDAIRTLKPVIFSANSLSEI
jgi:hypothetical protein